jgi:hypothetical protein
VKIEQRLNLKTVMAAKDRAKMVGLLMGGEMVLKVSNERVPHEDGDLERTGAVTGDVEESKVAISYRDVAYRGQAVHQHEDMTLKHDEGRQAKYLETALQENRDAVLQAVAGQLRKAFS